MTSLNTNGSGLQFLKECLKNYWSGSLFWQILGILYLVCLVYILLQVIWLKKRPQGLRLAKRDRCLFFWPAVIWSLTILNPFVAKFLIGFMPSFQERYYRFLWVFPVPILIGYVAFRLWQLLPRVGRFLLIGAGAALCLICFKDLHPILTHPQNICKVSNEEIEISDILAEDRGGNEEPVTLLYDIGSMYTLHAYDASLNSAVTRDTFQKYMTDWDGITEELQASAVENKNADEILTFSLFNGQNIPLSALSDALEEKNVRYMVFPKGWTSQISLFSECGYIALTETENFIILKKTD